MSDYVPCYLFGIQPEQENRRERRRDQPFRALCIHQKVCEGSYEFIPWRIRYCVSDRRDVWDCGCDDHSHSAGERNFLQHTASAQPIQVPAPEGYSLCEKLRCGTCVGDTDCTPAGCMHRIFHREDDTCGRTLFLSPVIYQFDGIRYTGCRGRRRVGRADPSSDHWYTEDQNSPVGDEPYRQCGCTRPLQRLPVACRNDNYRRYCDLCTGLYCSVQRSRTQQGHL